MDLVYVKYVNVNVNIIVNVVNNVNLMLNIGCGGSSRYPFKGGSLSETQLATDKVHVDLEIDQERAVFHGHVVLRADAQMLPFRAYIFDQVYASHVLEHCLLPPQALREWGRVSRGVVEIRVPDKMYQSSQEQDDHYYTWTRHSLENLLRIFFVHVEVTTNFRISLSRKILDTLRLHAWIRHLRLISKGELMAIASVFRGSLF